MDEQISVRIEKRRDARHPICPTCGTEFKYRAKRNIFVKLVFFWLPVKRYFCTRCSVCRHIFKPQFAEPASA